MARSILKEATLGWKILTQDRGDVVFEWVGSANLEFREDELETLTVL
jgi:hypothetical protein